MGAIKLRKASSLNTDKLQIEHVNRLVCSGVDLNEKARKTVGVVE